MSGHVTLLAQAPPRLPARRPLHAPRALPAVRARAPRLRWGASGRRAAAPARPAPGEGSRLAARGCGRGALRWRAVSAPFDAGRAGTPGAARPRPTRAAVATAAGLSGSLPRAGARRCPGGETGSRAPWRRAPPGWGGWAKGMMSARAPPPAAHSREEPPAVAADKEAVSPAASRPAEPLPPPEREGKEAAREDRAAAASSAGARGEPSPAPVLGHSVPQAAVPVRPLALHLAHKARGPGGPVGGEPLPPPPRDPPAEDAAEQEAAAGPEEKPQQPPLPPKENPWTKKPLQHLSPAGSGPPPPPLEPGLWLRGAGHPPARGHGGGAGLIPCQSEVFCSKVSFTLPVDIHGHLGRARQEEVGPRRLLDRWGSVARGPAGAGVLCLAPHVFTALGKLHLRSPARCTPWHSFRGLSKKGVSLYTEARL